jgi:hypothetical protein
LPEVSTRNENEGSWQLDRPPVRWNPPAGQTFCVWTFVADSRTDLLPEASTRDENEGSWQSDRPFLRRLNPRRKRGILAVGQTFSATAQPANPTVGQTFYRRFQPVRKTMDPKPTVGQTFCGILAVGQTFSATAQPATKTSDLGSRTDRLCDGIRQLDRPSACGRPSPTVGQTSCRRFQPSTKTRDLGSRTDLLRDLGSWTDLFCDGSTRNENEGSWQLDRPPVRWNPPAGQTFCVWTSVADSWTDLLLEVSTREKHEGSWQSDRPFLRRLNPRIRQSDRPSACGRPSPTVGQTFSATALLKPESDSRTDLLRVDVRR